jgi:4-diphosphocytidyl-2-C-methyl-D-erythritol kinase
MNKITVDSPAKINLGLNVIRKRDDGFHDLETVFLPIMLSDKITFCRSDKLTFDSNNKHLIGIEDNLIIRAIRLLKSNSGIDFNLSIYVEKIIPIGGGLGGGSSNAALTLKTLNKMFNLGFTYSELAQFALSLGSDVPYFLNPVPCYAESRGEILHPLKLEIPYPILIVNPGIKVETALAFKQINPARPVKSLRGVFTQGILDFDEIKSSVKNDFEEIVFETFPDLKKIKDDLYDSGAEFALMSGTGSTVYGIFTNLQKATWAEDNFKQKYFTYLNIPFEKGSIT